MGWIPFSTKQAANPIDQLDPKLREFLEKEAPVKYTPAKPPAAASPKKQEDDSRAVKAPQSKPLVPSASLFQDGRYEHLWKTYRPLKEIEDETATDNDRMRLLMEGYKGRKAAIVKVALENCALQQEEWTNCMKDGSWEDRFQMCRHQVRRFERCYTMQARFLRALGHGSVEGRPAEVDDEIQMHADTLYQRMLQHEAAVEQAKTDGSPIPEFDLRMPEVVQNMTTPSAETQAKWKEKLAGLPEGERAAEEAALRADLQSKTELARNLKKIMVAKAENRDQRIYEGKGTFLDSVSALLWKGPK